MPTIRNQEMFDLNELTTGGMFWALICLRKLRLLSTLATLCIWRILKVFTSKWCEKKHVLNRLVPPVTVRSDSFTIKFISVQQHFPKSFNPNYPTFRLKMLKKQKRTFPTFVFPEKPLPFSNSSHTVIIILVQGFWTQCHTIFIIICKNLAI